jgi:prolyl oligopeptidase
MEMERALRLVIDTGLHWKGWTLEESALLMSKYLSSSMDEVLVEVMRYAVLPAQALAYKVGEMHIKKLRHDAEMQLGDKLFDVREFHSVLLSAGSLPLEMLEEEVKKWIASVRR